MKSNDRALSPIIGVIFMVLVTVILAGIVAAFVFGDAGELHEAKDVTIIVHRVNTTAVTATIYGGDDVDTLKQISWEVSANPVKTQTGAFTVGESTTFAATMNSRVTGVATFTDGDTKIIYDSVI